MTEQLTQYQNAIKILHEAIYKLRDTHIFPKELNHLECSLMVDIMYLESCERLRLKEGKEYYPYSSSQGTASSNGAGVENPLFSCNAPGKVLPDYSDKANQTPQETSNPCSPGDNSQALVLPTNNQCHNPIRASTSEKRRLEKLKERRK